jgi:hypothetical protein
VRGYLEDDACIQPDSPRVSQLAETIVASLPDEDRNDTREVVWAIYEWLVRHLDHDSVYARTGERETDANIEDHLKTPYQDVTSGIWQTLSLKGSCWATNFYDWAYSQEEVLDVRCAICAELAWLASALLRHLNIPARATVGSHEFWAQTGADHGVWVHQSITSGRIAFRETGRLGEAFEGLPPEGRFSALSRPVIHEDWNAKTRGVWRETHPWAERYEASSAGYQQALADLKAFSETGDAPLGTIPPPRPGRHSADDVYQIHYSHVTINLFNLSDQRTLDVRFPMGSDGGRFDPTWYVMHWTNHPECVTRTWIEEVPNPPAEGAERWYHVAFDLASLFGE